MLFSFFDEPIIVQAISINYLRDLLAIFLWRYSINRIDVLLKLYSSLYFIKFTFNRINIRKINEALIFVINWNWTIGYGCIYLHNGYHFTVALHLLWNIRKVPLKWYISAATNCIAVVLLAIKVKQWKCVLISKKKSIWSYGYVYARIVRFID